MRYPPAGMPRREHEYVIRRTPSVTFGRCSCKGWAGRIQLNGTCRRPQTGWTDGPIRDPDRVTGNADRPRSRRAPARWASTVADPGPGRALPLTSGPRKGRDIRPLNRVGAEDSLLLPLVADNRTKRRRSPPPGVASSFPRRFNVSDSASRRRRSPERARPYVIRRRPRPSDVAGDGSGPVVACDRHATGPRSLSIRAADATFPAN